MARELRFDPGTIVIVDRGYTDYDWFETLSHQSVWFVTRMKDNADFVVVEDRPVPAGNNVRSDQVISLFQHARQEKNLFFRRVVVWDEQNQRELVFLTNHLKFAASTIAAIYKDRWRVELFFESSTWCTPLYVMELQESFVLNRTLVGVPDVSVRPYIFQRRLCA